MKQSRRSFLQNSLTAIACSITPSFLTTACLPERSDPLIIDFIGNAENYSYFRDYFRRIKKAELVQSTLERSATSRAAAVLLDSSLPMKPTYAILLLEQGKDVLSSYPIASGLSDYNSLQENIIRYNRRLGLINPLLFYPSVLKLKDTAGISGDQLVKITISCNPLEIEPGYRIAGITGPVQLLHGMVSYLSESHPVSLVSGRSEDGQISNLQLNYPDFQAVFILDPRQTGWTMDITAEKTSALLDHTGLLAMDDEVQPRIDASPRTWELAMVRNLEDFIDAVQSRSEPMLSSLEGLASIILNRAAEESLETGAAVRL